MLAPGSLPAEDELLLLLLAPPHAPGRQDRLRDLVLHPPDWAAFVRHADAHGVAPLAAHHLATAGVRLPAPPAEQLEHLVSLYRRRNLFLAAELRQILAILAPAGIAAIPLKGTTLAEGLYGSFTLRVSTDIDVLVRRAQAAAAVEALEANGYRPQGPWRRWLAAAYHCEVPLVPQEGSLCYPLDLHWGLLSGDPRHREAAEECWAEARPATAAGAPAWAMSPEWDLLFLVVHAARSQWQGLKVLVDFQQACWTWRLDWDRVRTLARRWEWEDVLQLTLQACRRWWPLPAPAGEGRAPWPSWLRSFPHPPRETRWAGLRVACLLIRPWRLRAGYLLGLLGTSSPNDYRWLPLPPALSPLYVLLRPVRWIAMGARGCVRGVARRLRASAARPRRA